MNSKLVCALALAAALVLSTASAQTGGRGSVTEVGPPADIAPQRARTLAHAELSSRVTLLEAQVAQLASRVETLNALVADYPTHRHNFNDDTGPGASAHDVTGLPHQ